jgi:hypothetical protein
MLEVAEQMPINILVYGLRVSSTRWHPHSRIGIVLLGMKPLTNIADAIECLHFALNPCRPRS